MGKAVEFLAGIAAVGIDVLARGVHGIGQVAQGAGLDEGFAAGERDARQQGILHELAQDVVRIPELPAVEVMGLRIVAARAMMGTALGEDHVAQSGTVHDGFFHDAADAEPRHA